MHEQYSSHSAVPPGAVHGNDPPRPRPGPRHREGRPGRVEGQGRAEWKVRDGDLVLRRL